MIHCNICGADYETRRKMHGHLMHSHYQEYKQAGFDMDLLTSGAPLRAHVAAALKSYPRPEGFRRLRSYTSVAEAQAIEAGYMFIDQEENIYTEAEARAKSWI